MIISIIIIREYPPPRNHVHIHLQFDKHASAIPSLSRYNTSKNVRWNWSLVFDMVTQEGLLNGNADLTISHLVGKAVLHPAALCF
jgi:hypothetical protein